MRLLSSATGSFVGLTPFRLMLSFFALLASVAARAEVAPGLLATPISPACLSSPFGERDAGAGGPRASRVHRGIDLRAPAGAWVRAAAAGQVMAVRRRGAVGLELELGHPGGFTTRYAHLGTVAPALASGKRTVTQGEVLGRVGRTGITYGTHLHFELLVDGSRVDPAPHLRVEPCGGPGSR
jgi:murein DD-endopeptidase MepM/ murein hydrolase activator NlpD